MRNVIVTGASRGLGLAITRALAAGGYRVLAIARTQSEPLRALCAGSAVGTANTPATAGASGAASAAGTAGAAQTAQGPGAVQFHAFDLLKTDALGQLVSGLRRQVGPLYGLVNNAGLGTAGVLAMMRDEQVETLVRLNTISPILLTKHVVRSMMSERAGRIVNISSVVAATGYQGLAAYAATKASLVGFTRSLAREVGPLGITVNAIAPGFVATEMTSELTGKQREQLERRSALKRLPDAEDVAAAVTFLLSEQARNITGTTLTVDAGNTA